MKKVVCAIGVLMISAFIFTNCGGGVVYNPYYDEFAVVIDPLPDYNSVEGTILDDRPDLYTIWIEDSYGHKYFAGIDIYGGYYFIDWFPSEYYWIYATDGWQTKVWGPIAFYGDRWIVNIDLYGNDYWYW